MVRQLKNLWNVLSCGYLRFRIRTLEYERDFVCRLAAENPYKEWQRED